MTTENLIASKVGSIYRGHHTFVTYLIQIQFNVLHKYYYRHYGYT